MKLTKVVTVEIEEVEDILCNKCGASLKCELNTNGLVEAEVRGGYDSPHLTDGEIYEFSLCEKCLVELFENFKFPPGGK